MQNIESELENRIETTAVVSTEIDYVSKSIRTRITETRAAMHRDVDEYGNAMLQQTATHEREQRRRLDDYGAELKNESQDHRKQQAWVVMLRSSKDPTKLLENKEPLEKYVRKKNEKLEKLQAAVTTFCPSEQFDHMRQEFNERINWRGRFINYYDPKNDKRLADDEGNQTHASRVFHSNDFGVTNTTAVLRNNIVRKKYLFFALVFY
jgi:hypothetical protein